VNIIIVSNRMAKPKVLTLRQVLLFLLMLALLPIAAGWALTTTAHDTASQHDVKHLLPPPLRFSLLHPQEHLDALALQLGELQARVMQLDALSERLAKLAGAKEAELEPAAVPGRGGPQVNARPSTEQELQQHINQLAQELAQRSDRLDLLESMLLQKNLQKNTMPNGQPVEALYNSSSYGWRPDPFNGRMAFHEGLDFSAARGTPIYAAAGGIVTAAQRTPDYGNLVKIDHGSGLETRYAHASRLLVRIGERVKKGQVIAEVGSTGRSTGPHLHFEVRSNGRPMDPRKFLQNRPS
jgi:murein DD-endopeptidase MepM/ murein hydrolase activator NlpD